MARFEVGISNIFDTARRSRSDGDRGRVFSENFTSKGAAARDTGLARGTEALADGAGEIECLGLLAFLVRAQKRC